MGRRGGVLDKEDGGPLAGAEEVVLRLSDPASESIGQGALALPSEGSRTDPLLSRRGLRLDDEEGRGESSVGHSSSGDEGLLLAEGSCGERRVRGGHTEPAPGRRMGSGRGGGSAGRAHVRALGGGGGA